MVMFLCAKKMRARTGVRRIIRRRRPRRWMSSSTRCPTILTLRLVLLLAHHTDKSTGG